MTGNNMSRVWQVQKADLFIYIEPETEIDRSPTLRAQRGRGICEQEAGWRDFRKAQTGESCFLKLTPRC